MWVDVVTEEGMLGFILASSANFHGPDHILMCSVIHKVNQNSMAHSPLQDTKIFVDAKWGISQ